MKAGNKIAVLCMAALFTLTGTFAQPQDVYAKAITSASQAQTKALKKVEGATVIEVEYDVEDGVGEYDVELVKGSKKYDITYRASDGKMLSYGWEKTGVTPSYDKPIISMETCKSKAQKKVKSAELVSINQKTDDGIDIYKVKMSSSTKKYDLKYHARTGALIEYDWELKTTTAGTDSGYIGSARAKEIALAEVPGATVVKCELDTDDGVKIYEVELVKDIYEYELEIDAKTGKILKYDRDRIDD